MPPAIQKPIRIWIAPAAPSTPGLTITFLEEMIIRRTTLNDEVTLNLITHDDRTRTGSPSESLEHGDIYLSLG